MRLEYLHRHSNQMEYQYHTCFAHGLESHHEEDSLEGKCHNEQEVVSIEDIIERIIVIRQSHHNYEESSEYTGICLLVDERDEVVEQVFHENTIEKSEKIAKSIKNKKL